MKKILSILGAGALVLIVVLILFLGNIIKAGIETAGPELIGVPISVEKVKVNPLTGTVHIKALMIGNPEGFKTESLMKLGEFNLDLSLASLFSDTIFIKKIRIDAPEITYEKALRSSNFNTLMNHLPPPKTQEDPGGETPADPAPAKKVMIEDFQLNDAKVHVTLTALGGKKMTLPLPDIRMQNIGKGTGGANIREVVAGVFASIRNATLKAISTSGELAGGILKDTGGTATDAAKDAAESLKRGIGGLFGNDE